MKLELRKATDGTGFVICVCGERSYKQIVIPLSADLTDRIAQMMRAEGIGIEALILPPN